ncbi:MAG: reverse transcriptase family protein, partial [Pseudomonadota bacterium]|nr:reverse transcriptase family protein [Pseudomonadota bacterium]
LFIYRNSISNACIPSQWKLSTVVPIFKKGNRSQPTNYRPIALTSSFCRILERIISKHLLHHLISNNLLLPNQFGFVPNRSSCDQLLWCLNDWCVSYGKSISQYVVYTDITKAFDSVSHKKLVDILKSYGVYSKLLIWFDSFLTNRLQIVKINSTSSSALPITSGVPQGSVIGPLTFLIFLNDIILKIQSQHNVKIALFADDAKFQSNDPIALQACLNTFSDTIFHHQLKLAPHKCQTLYIAKKNL